MSVAFMLLLQAGAGAAAGAAAPVPWAIPGLAPIDFDLSRYRASGDGADGAECAGTGGPGEVVVCGRRRAGPGAYPMAQWERIFATHPFVAETGIAGNVRGDIHGESVMLDRGAVSNRVMVRIKVPF